MHAFFSGRPHFEPDSPVIEKWNPNKPVSVIYYDGEKKKYFVKRFMIDKAQKPETVISQAKGSFMAFVSTEYLPMASVSFAKEKGAEPKEDMTVNVAEFIAVKGIRAQGNQLSPDKVKAIKALEPLPYDEPEDEEEQEDEYDENAENNSDVDTGSQDDPYDEEHNDDDPDAAGEPGTGESGEIGDGGQISLF